MTPEELNRTMEFILQSQARLAAAQEQDQEDRVHFDRRFAALLDIQVRLLESQTRRLDDYEKENRAAHARHDEAQRLAQKRHEELHAEFLQLMQETRDSQVRFQANAQKHHEETVAWLRHILERLTDRLN